MGQDITPPTPADTDEGSEADQAEAEASTKTESAPADEAAADETETEPEQSDEGEKDQAEVEQEPARFQKRIDELTEARVKAEQEAATLREQLAAAKVTALDPTNPFNLIDNEQDLAVAVNREQEFMDWIEDNINNLEGADLPDGKGGTVHFEPEQIRQMKVNTRRILRTAEQRREFIRQKAARDAETAGAYPWLRSTQEGLGAEVQREIEARPYLRQSPDYRRFAADALIGAKLRAAGVKLDEHGIANLLKGRVTKAAAPAAAALPAPRQVAVVRRTAPSPARPGNLPPRFNGREAAARQANKALATGDGSLASVSDSIAAKLRW